MQVGPRALLRHPRADDQAEFLALVRASRALHKGWVSPPATPDQFATWFVRQREPNQELHLVCRRADGALCGVMNLTEIVRGPLLSANLGYYAFAPTAGHGYMREGMQLVLAQAFRGLGLHRVEANIQPDNSSSLALALLAGFQPEGYSPRYLKIAGSWRDHLRLAILEEDWRAEPVGPAAPGRSARRLPVRSRRQ